MGVNDALTAAPGLQSQSLNRLIRHVQLELRHLQTVEREFSDFIRRPGLPYLGAKSALPCESMKIAA